MADTIKQFIYGQWKEWRGTLLFFALVVVPVKSSLADINWVPTGSMNPTIVEGDLVYVDKLAYDLRLPLSLHSMKRLAEPERGDIAVFFSPEDRKRLVKRVIAVPGDTVEMVGNILFINGEQLGYGVLSKEETRDLEDELRRHAIFAEEDLAGHKHAVMSVPAILSDQRSFGKVTVPQGCFFVMGDNRDMSKDSRYFGLVERKLFVGEAKAVVVSFDILDKFQPRFGRFFSALN